MSDRMSYYQIIDSTAEPAAPPKRNKLTKRIYITLLVTLTLVWLLLCAIALGDVKH
ncbi:MAG: hypothetical protein R2867_15620 [Caldilineaceae bacterium]